MNKERWKQVEEYSNYYVSDFGNVKNSKGEILKKISGKNGYCIVGLYCKKTKKIISVLVSRLVAKAFLEPKGKFFIKYKDKNRANICLDNLIISESNRSIRAIKPKKSKLNRIDVTNRIELDNWIESAEALLDKFKRFPVKPPNYRFIDG